VQEVDGIVRCEVIRWTATPTQVAAMAFDMEKFFWESVTSSRHTFTDGGADYVLIFEGDWVRASSLEGTLRANPRRLFPLVRKANQRRNQTERKVMVPGQNRTWSPWVGWRA
jgi:hypothetical protein